MRVNRFAVTPVQETSIHRMIRMNYSTSVFIASNTKEMSQNTSDILSESDYHSLADTCLDEILTATTEIESAIDADDVDISLEQGVLNIDLGKYGFWVINKQTPNRQIWWSSPVSGPRRYEYVYNNEIKQLVHKTKHVSACNWIHTRSTNDDSNLFVDLKDELLKVTGVDISAHMKKKN